MGVRQRARPSSPRPPPISRRHTRQHALSGCCARSEAPSALEITAVGRLAEAGWRVAARADFDQAGLQHVTALLTGVPAARPWRMTATDYLASLATTPADNRITLHPEALPATEWDPALRNVMSECGLAAYEESLTEAVLIDLATGRPQE